LGIPAINPTSFKFPDDVRDVLRQAGWSENRQADISLIVTDLRVCGYEIHPAAEHVLKSFAGLALIGPGGLSLICEEVAGIGKFYLHNQIDSLLGGIFRDAYPIGYACSSCIFLLPDRTVLGLHYDLIGWLQFLSFERFVECVLGMRPFQPEERFRYMPARDRTPLLQ
jgi:hypothetical protein